jgi:hypothetical protein
LTFGAGSNLAEVACAAAALLLAAACQTGEKNPFAAPSGPGPWPEANAQFGAADGIAEAPVVGFSTDETQNRWAATHQALYLMRPGEKRFRRYDARDGLHLQGNPERYCDGWAPDRACPIYGAAADPGITEIAGGGPNEVFVGYAGNEAGSQEYDDPNRHTGKLDRVRLKSDGTLSVDRFDLVAGVSAQFWHDRTVQRLLYDHVQHPRVCYHAACSGDSNQRIGDWRGLALAPDGDLWVAGKWTAGKIRWTADNATWYSRRGAQAFALDFGDPYPQQTSTPGFFNEPVFRVAQEGDTVSLSAVAVGKDGRVWFASDPLSSRDLAWGVAAWDGRTFRAVDPQAELGLAEAAVRDVVALPDGRLVFAAPSTGLVVYDPATLAHVALRGRAVLPDDRVLRLDLDARVRPFALHVATAGGAAVLRTLP